MIWSMLATMAMAVTAHGYERPCRPIVGAEQLLGDRSLRWLIFGEMHGTAETPAAFAELVCAAVRSHRRIVVALERPIEEQAAIDAFLHSDGGTAARGALLANAGWRPELADGRSSAAMLGLLDRLRLLARHGRIAQVVAFQPAAAPIDVATYERLMAETLTEASPVPATLVVALVGNIHARMTPWMGSHGSYMPMAGLLPRATTRAFDIRGAGGAAWACMQDRKSSPPATRCGSTELAGPRLPATSGLRFSDMAGAPYSGWIDLGTPTTASPPAVERPD